MSSKRNSVFFTLASSLVLTFSAPASAANLDDGYPKDSAAPSRTCPMADEGFKTVSDYSGKTLVCTVIGGVKKWWIEGDPLPAATGSNSDSVPEIQLTHTYSLPAKSLATMKVFENVTYATQSPSQHLDLYMPKGVVKPPLLVWTHGGGFVIGNEDIMKYDEAAKLLEVFIKNGIAVASVNYRLSQEAIFPAAGVDTKRAIRFLRANASKYGYDPKKFAVGGDSAGGYLALMAAITGDQSSPFDDATDPNRKTSAAVSVVMDVFGNADFFEMALNNTKYPCDQSKNPWPVPTGNIHPWFGDITDPSVQAAMKSAGLYPYLKSSKALPAFYIFHGSDDCSVSPYDSKNLDKAVKALKGKSTLTLVAGAIHGGAGVFSAIMKAVPAIKKSIVTVSSR
ncbi:MAG: alpha/beta hydrolase [Actinomycetes bacterium]|jgi:acetyl esterase/lipase